MGEISKKCLCLRCIASVDACVFEDDDFLVALEPARTYEKAPTHPSIDSTTTSSELDTVGIPDEMPISLLASDDVLKRSQALLTLDRLVNSQVENKMKQSGVEKLREGVLNCLRRALRNTLRDT